MTKSDIIVVIGTVLAEAVIVGVYIRSTKKLMKSIEESYDEEVCETKEES